MFAFSLSKLIVLIGMILAVWYGFKLIGRFQELREFEARRRAKEKRDERMQAGATREIEDTVKCRVCGSYVTTRGATNCGQPGCPYGR